MAALLERITEGRVARSFPIGVEVSEWDRELGHRDDFGPEQYGNYLATSNDIYSIVTFRARHMGSLPLLAYRGRGPEKQLVTEGDLVDLLHRVNPHWTFPRLMRQTEMAMGVWGEAFWALDHNPKTRKRELWWLRPTRTHPVPHPTEWLSGFLYEPSTGAEPIPFSADEVIWFRYPNPLDEYAGLSPLAAARLAADVASAAMTSNRNLFRQGLQIGGLLMPKDQKVTFSPDQADDLEAMLDRRFRGVDRAHRWGVLRFEAQTAALGVTPKDAEFLAALNVTFRQACRAYGVPSPLLYDLEHATLANLRELQRAFWEHGMVPDANFYLADLEEQLLPVLPGAADHVEWDYSTIPVMQELFTSTWDRERSQLEGGVLTINEWRKQKGKPPVPWGDVWWAPLNKAPVSDASQPTISPSTDEGRSSSLLASLIAAELADLQGANGHGA